MVLSPREQLRAMGITLDEMEADLPPEPLKFQDVQRGPELHRILGLPRRPIPSQTDPENVALAEFLTQHLARVPEPYPGRLKTTQALALKEAYEARGLVAPIVVGGGKMLLSYLLPAVLGARRPLLVTMAQMIPDTRKQFALYQQSWHGPSAVGYPILSYELIAAPSSGEDLAPDGSVVRASRLDRMAPDLIVLDEAHRAGDSGSTTTKRLKAYLKKNPETIVVAMTGTLFRTSIKDAAHIFDWALGERSPLPRDFLERESWASYLDARKSIGPRTGVGALVDLLSPEETSQLAFCEGDEARSVVRGAVSRRILETPGVVGTQDAPLDIPLHVTALYPEHEDPAIEDAIAELRLTGTLPDGTELADMMQVARHEVTMGRGHWNKWDPMPPQEWRDARNAWSKWCRRAIKSNRRGVDSEARMKAAVRKGIFNDEGTLAAWEAADKAERARTGLREPPSVAQWISDEAIHAVRAWLKDHPAGLVWVDSIGLGVRLSDELGVPYYGAESRDKHRRHILDHPGGPAIASKASCGTGKNLQGLWHENLWLCPPGEQELARTHRPGQKAEAVHNWVYLGCAAHLRAYYAARSTKARFTEELQSSPQKIRYAQTDMPSARELEQRGPATARWGGKDE